MLQKGAPFSEIPLTPQNGCALISHEATLFSKGERLTWETVPTIFFSLQCKLFKISVAICILMGVGVEECLPFFTAF